MNLKISKQIEDLVNLKFYALKVTHVLKRKMQNYLENLKKVYFCFIIRSIL